MGYEVQLDVFAGPLDLLLHLIEQSKIDIYDIPMAKITDQYLNSLAALEQLNLDLASDFLVMAATLLLIKTRMLLPPPIKEAVPEEGEETDPREELVQKLLEYKKFKLAAARLNEHSNQRDLLFSGVVGVPPADREPPPPALVNLTLADLAEAFRAVCESLPEEPVTQIPRDEISIRQRIETIRQQVDARPAGLSFRSLFRPHPTRVEVVITFIALLELMRSRQVRVYQGANFGEIWLYRNGEETGDDLGHQ